MPNPVAAIGGSAVLGAATSSRASRRASSAEDRAADAAAQVQRESLQSFEERTDPFRRTGLAAAVPLLTELGIEVPQSLLDQINPPPETTEAAPRNRDLEALTRFVQRRANDPSFRITSPPPEQAAETSDPVADPASTTTTPADTPTTPPGGQTTPLVEFLRREGFEDIQESAAAQGRLRSGGTLEDLTRFNTELALTGQQQRFNQLFSLLGLGSNAATGQGTAALSTGANLSNIRQQQGANQAGGIIERQNILNDTIGLGANLAGFALGGSGLPGFGGGTGTPPFFPGL